MRVLTTQLLLTFLPLLSCQGSPGNAPVPGDSVLARTPGLSQQELTGWLRTLHARYAGRIMHWDRVLIADFRRSIDEERFYLVDGTSGKILLRTTVAHGVNSGTDYAAVLSDEVGSLRSSAGGFLTGVTYQGTFGYSLTLKGLDPHLNGHAEQRHIIVHSSRIMRTKYSWGCFAVPEEHHRRIIDAMKGGRLLYVITDHR